MHEVTTRATEASAVATEVILHDYSMPPTNAHTDQTIENNINTTADLKTKENVPQEQPKPCFTMIKSDPDTEENEACGKVDDTLSDSSSQPKDDYIMVYENESYGISEVESTEIKDKPLIENELYETLQEDTNDYIMNHDYTELEEVITVQNTVHDNVAMVTHQNDSKKASSEKHGATEHPNSELFDSIELLQVMDASLTRFI